MKIKSFTTKTFILAVILLQSLGCEKKEANDDGEFLLNYLLFTSLSDSVCTSLTPSSAKDLTINSGGYYGDISTAPSVPPGKQCYFKFTPTVSGLYQFDSFGVGSTSSDISNGIYHIGLVGKTPTKIPSTTSSFDDENLFTNIPANFSDSTAVVTTAQFYQSANTTRIIIADGTKCTSNCKIGIKIAPGVNGNSIASSYTCGGAGSKAINKTRFDESGISFQATSTACYFLFVSPKASTMQLTQTRTDSGGTNPTMTLSVSAAVSSASSTFTSATFTTSTTAATLNGLITPAGSGRYIEAKYSPEPTGFTFRMTNSY